ncbi:MAG: hypothetical protein ACTSW1_12660 [Candidatus Hodarchaeales archaeon]
MSNPLNDTNDQLNEIKTNLSTTIEKTKSVPEKINQLIKMKEELSEENRGLILKSKELKDEIVKIESKMNDLRQDYERKLEMSENKIVALQRDLDLAKDDKNKLEKKIIERDKRIEILESQKEELTQALRQKQI